MGRDFFRILKILRIPIILSKKPGRLGTPMRANLCFARTVCGLARIGLHPADTPAVESAISLFIALPNGV